MIRATRQAEVDSVDAFLAAPKILQGLPPTWRDSSWAGEYQAIWNIEDEAGVTNAQLRFCSQKANHAVTSVSLIYRGQSITRIDLDPSDVCHPNPPWASKDLPPRVCGPHAHRWIENRRHILTQEDWDLPCRTPLPPTVRRLGQGLLWLADEINLTLGSDQRGFEGPTQRDLFDLGGR